MMVGHTLNGKDPLSILFLFLIILYFFLLQLFCI